MKSDYTVVVLSMEMMIPELPEPARGANFRGGLGILAGDIMAGLKKLDIKAFGIVPFYRRHWINDQEVVYGEPARKILEFNSLDALEINRGGTTVYGLMNQIFDRLYTIDRWQRAQQEIIFGKTAPLLLKELGIKPDIIWFNESHTAVFAEAIKEDPYFKETKIVFTIHTPDPAGMERFPEQWFNELKISREKYYPIFVKDNCLDLTRAVMIMADKINSVSQEHCSVTQEKFPEYTQKTIGIRNGSDRDLWLSPRLKEAGDDIDSKKLWAIHQQDKQEFIDFVEGQAKITLNPSKPLVGLIRRFVPYKNQYPLLEPIIRATCAERGETVETSCGRLAGLGMQMFCAGLPSENDDYCRDWVRNFENWMKEPILRGNFVFLDDYCLTLLRKGAAGCDVWLSCPWPKWEACGTSDQRAAINGNINVSTRTGGAMEYIKEINPATGEGNGLFIEPYDCPTLYQKLKLVSDLYYDFQVSGKDSWLKVRMNAFETGKLLDIVPMVREYREKIFAPLLNGSP